jgi:hypothetical protein
MASSNPPAVKRAGNPRNKRFVQPVVSHQTDLAANGSIQEASEEESRRASAITSPNLPNGVHQDEIQEASEKGAAVETEGSSAAASPVSHNGRSAPTTSHMLCISGTLESA